MTEFAELIDRHTRAQIAMQRLSALQRREKRMIEQSLSKIAESRELLASPVRRPYPF